MISKYIYEVVADYIALGVDPKITNIFIQSKIASQILTLTVLLARHISVAELLRVPTLKDKLKAGARPETANSLLLLYPVIMAADILLERAKKVPVGEDQLAHLEVARELARRFNARYGEVFPLPKAHQLKALRILSLKGAGKMSKSVPEGAIFLTDSPASAVRKIRKAQTAVEGVMSASLQSHIVLAHGLARAGTDVKKINELVKAHMQGKPVMKDFKELLAEIVTAFLENFQSARKQILTDPDFVPAVLEQGLKVARANAEQTLELVHQALK